MKEVTIKLIAPSDYDDDETLVANFVETPDKFVVEFQAEVEKSKGDKGE